MSEGTTRETKLPPERIYLQLFGADKDDLSPDELKQPADLIDVTWCWHKIYDTDVEYVLAGKKR